MIAAEGNEVQVVSAMPAFQTRRHTSSVEVVVARRSDHRHTSPVTDLSLPGLETRRGPGPPLGADLVSFSVNPKSTNRIGTPAMYSCSALV